MPIKKGLKLAKILFFGGIFYILLPQLGIATIVQAAYPCTIQGYKIFENNHGTGSPIDDQTVTVVGEGSSNANPYFINSSGGTKTVSVTLPSGYDVVGYTLCYNRTDCHDASPAIASSATVNCNGGYVDLWWHYYAPPRNLGCAYDWTMGAWYFYWDPPLGNFAERYAIRINDLANPWCDPPVSNCSTPPNCTRYEGDYCTDYVYSTYYFYNALPGHSYSWWVHGIDDNPHPTIWGSAAHSTCVIPTPTNTPTPTPTPTPYIAVSMVNPRGVPSYKQICRASWAGTNCDSVTGSTTDSCAVRASYTAPILQDRTCSGVSTPLYVFNDLLGVTPVPSANYKNPTDSTNAFYGWAEWLTGGRNINLVFGNNIRGWVYMEKTANPPIKDASDDLLSGYTVNLTGDKTGSVTTLNTNVSGYTDANYIFNKLTDGVYNITLNVTPTRAVLLEGYTNPQVGIMIEGNTLVHFPFVTAAPTATPTRTPTPTPLPPTSTPIPTPTAIATPSVCQPIPTPVLNSPAHELCTKTKPTFSAYVENKDNGEYVWAHFYSNAYEKFSQIGSSVPPSGGNSTWSADNSFLNSTGGYWWTAYAESPSCPDTYDAPARLLNMDYQAPPKPTPPTCTMTYQNLISGQCTFRCTWPADPEPTPPSCSDTAEYQPTFWTDINPTPYKPSWSNALSSIVYTEDGAKLYSQLQARDGLGNTSPLSDTSGPVECPRININDTPTPGGPTVPPTRTPTPTGSPTPTITPTPTPGAWIQVLGGDVYMSSINQPIPAGKYFLDNLSGIPNSSGVIRSISGSGNFGSGSSSPTNWRVAGALSNKYTFSYYWETLKSRAKSVEGTTVVGTPTNLNTTDSIYSYEGAGYYSFDKNFNGRIAGAPDVTVFLITGTLEITEGFTLPSEDRVIFIVNGNLYIAGNVKNIQGLFMSGDTFTIGPGDSNIVINGMVITKKLSLQRTYQSLSTPAYQFIYQPKYMLDLLGVMGRTQVKWQEVTP